MAREKSTKLVVHSDKKVTKDNDKATNNLKHFTNLLAGASLVQFRPLFSHDARFLFIISGKNVKVFSTTSGECFRVLIGHESPVISLQSNPNNQFQIFSCSEDGTVIKWNYEDGTKIKVFKLNCVSSVKCFYIQGNNWFVVPADKVNDVYQLYNVKPVDGSGEKFTKHFALKPVSGDEKTIAFGNKGNFICSVHQNKLFVFNAVQKKYKVHMSKWNMLCVSCHPTDYAIATGDETGRIIIWTNFLEDNHPSRAFYHWHALPVGDLAFTAEGHYLYSGGSECVLVKWQLDTNGRQFLPRMGLPLCHVTTSPDNSYVATSHTDNRIQLVSAQNQVVRVILGLTKSKASEHTGLLYDPRSKCMVLNGHPGHLQFYHPWEDKHLFNLDVVGQNYITGRNKDEVIHYTEVERAAFDSSGTWMATAEYRDDGQTSVEIRLKFWRFDKTSQTFTLNTNIFLPHNKRIRNLKFKPEPEYSGVPKLLTTSADSKFKMWTLHEKQVSPSDNRSAWACHSQGYYHCLPAGDFDFSEDASLVGVAFGHVLTLWTVEVTALKSALICYHDSEDIRHVAFGHGAHCHLAVSTTSSSLTVWNVLSLTVSWTVQTSISHLIVDAFSDVMVAFTMDNNLFAFCPDSPTPLYIHPHISNIPIRAAAFIPSDVRRKELTLPWSPLSQLVFLNFDEELMIVTDHLEEIDEEEESQKSLVQNLPKTPFGLLMAQQRKSAAPKEEPIVHKTQGFVGLKELNEILNIPSHVLPPVSSICSNFMTSLLIQSEKKHVPKEPEKEKMLSEDLVKEDEKMEQTLTNELSGLNLESYDWLTDYLKT